jgi:hypothetical protein
MAFSLTLVILLVHIMSVVFFHLVPQRYHLGRLLRGPVEGFAVQGLEIKCVCSDVIHPYQSLLHCSVCSAETSKSEEFFCSVIFVIGFVPIFNEKVAVENNLFWPIGNIWG